ncbi:unnamed protein product [Boreogadus saida]
MRPQKEESLCRADPDSEGLAFRWMGPWKAPGGPWKATNRAPAEGPPGGVKTRERAPSALRQASLCGVGVCLRLSEQVPAYLRRL